MERVGERARNIGDEGNMTLLNARLHKHTQKRKEKSSNTHTKKEPFPVVILPVWSLHHRIKVQGKNYTRHVLSWQKIKTLNGMQKVLCL
jgi:hypothetical protein